MATSKGSRSKANTKTKKLAASSKQNQVNTRPPVVVVMGHVDHGKTSLLDFIRKTNVTERESGGITQHIGAYQVRVPHEGKDMLITFIDTPGHEAFSEMRSRGGRVADIAILVVAADDGVMPQTKEAIAHIKAAGIPMIVAVSKVDLPAGNVERVKKGLAEAGVLVEGYGGDVVTVPVSAKTGQGVPELLEMILLTAEIAELKGDPTVSPEGIVIESKMDKQRGPLATLLIKNGTLGVGQEILVGGVGGKVKHLTDGFGQSVESASPGMPVEIMGLEKVPAVGSELGQAGKILEEAAAVAFAGMFGPAAPGEVNIVLKADFAGSLEAILGSLAKLPQEETKLNIVLSGTGEISDSDINLAKATGSIVLGFRVKAGGTATRLAETQKVQVMTYDIIYQLLGDLKDALSGMALAANPEPAGVGDIIATFPHDNDIILGTKVKEGSIARDQPMKIMRGEEEVASGKIKTIRHLKEELPKAEAGKEYGILPALSTGTFADIKIGDQIISFPKG